MSFFFNIIIIKKNLIVFGLFLVYSVYVGLSHACVIDILLYPLVFFEKKKSKKIKKTQCMFGSVMHARLRVGVYIGLSACYYFFHLYIHRPRCMLSNFYFFVNFVFRYSTDASRRKASVPSSSSSSPPAPSKTKGGGEKTKKDKWI